MPISYTVVVQDELNDVKRLHHTIGVCKKPQDESIAVHLYREDHEMNDPVHVEIKEYLMNNFDTYCNYKNDNDITHLKNYVCDLATKDYVFLLDANEFLTAQTLALWNNVIKNEPEYDIFWTPRVNIDDTMSQKEKEERYGLKLNERGWINWPDNQPRIIRKSAGLIWEQHEQGIRIKGAKKSGSLTPDPRLATVNHKRNP
jgi:hypothetical protein